MNVGFVILAISVVGAGYATLVLRAAPTRRDNLLFGALALSDAVMTAWRGVNVLAGWPIITPSVTVPCSFIAIVMAVISIEFMSSFPRRPAPARPWTFALVAWGVAAVLVLLSVGHTSSGFWIAELSFYLPATLVIFALGVRAWRTTSDRNARAVIAALGFRWLSGLLAFFVGPLVDKLELFIWLDTMVATPISFVVIGTAVLRNDLFSLRSTAAEVLTIATIGALAVLGGGGAVFLTVHHTEPGTLRNVLDVGATFVPLAVAALGRAVYPRLEKNVLAGLDERRARRLAVHDEPLPVATDEALAEAVRRIAAISDGADVRWELAAQLAPELADELRTGEPHRGDRELVVPALGAERSLVGAFRVTGGTIDRDTYVVARDLAARLALIVERYRAVSELGDARRLAALGQFAAAIAHDIRTPLTSISLNVQILRRKLTLSDDDREHLDIALEELGRLDASVAQILEFAKPVKVIAQPIDVGELLEATTRGLSPVLSEKGVALHWQPPADALSIHGDPQRLRQVLVNLVDNAANASGSGAAVTVRARPAAAAVEIDVEDHGRGIAADDLPRIFEPFFTTRPDGTGLGLAICHKVVRAHGGDIRVRSTVGSGSTFTISLPVA
ncbi:MAG TPA: ATP-binding protein [Kofleriaceae bacterium]|jgi:signal transduction histidine kinase